MNEEEKQIVEVAKGAWSDDVMVQELVTIIDRLDKQLAEVKKVGEPFIRFHSLILHVNDENIALTVPPQMNIPTKLLTRNGAVSQKR